MHINKKNKINLICEIKNYYYVHKPVFKNRPPIYSRKPVPVIYFKIYLVLLTPFTVFLFATSPNLAQIIFFNSS